jgi:hypothetical protein
MVSIPQGIGLLFCMTGSLLLAFSRTPKFEDTKPIYKAGTAKIATILLSLGFGLQFLAFGISFWS